MATAVACAIPSPLPPTPNNNPSKNKLVNLEKVNTDGSTWSKQDSQLTLKRWRSGCEDPNYSSTGAPASRVIHWFAWRPERACPTAPRSASRTAWQLRHRTPELPSSKTDGRGLGKVTEGGGGVLTFCISYLLNHWPQVLRRTEHYNGDDDSSNNTIHHHHHHDWLIPQTNRRSAVTRGGTKDVPLTCRTTTTTWI